MKQTFRTPDPKQFLNKNTHLFLLKNSRGMEVALSDYGARIVSMIVPDKLGNNVDVVLGFDSIEGCLSSSELTLELLLVLLPIAYQTESFQLRVKNMK